jgi:inner membrane protein
VATGLIISQLVPAPSRKWSALAGAIFAELPDSDYVFAFWDRLSYLEHHRGFTHSLFALPLFALAGAVVGRALGGPRWFKPLFYLGLAVLASHLLLDLMTSYGTQILSPLSHRRFALDWVFIIDPYLTGALLLGAAAALISSRWGRRVGAACLVAASFYILLCGLFHHQALALARQLWFTGPQTEHRLAALPQPFSCRRWLLLASGPDGVIKQTFLKLTYGAWWGEGITRPQAKAAPQANPEDLATAPLYQPPDRLQVRTWTPAPAPPMALAPEAQALLQVYLAFARFPLLDRVQPLPGGGELLEWRDLRFTMPGREAPFTLRLYVDSAGRLQNWTLGRSRRAG